jgi:chemotaxis protein MotA
MIGGAAVGAFIVSNDTKIIKATLKALPSLFKGDKYNKQYYLQLLSVLFKVAIKIKREGTMAIEGDINNPEASALFSEYPMICHDHHAMEFICDYLRLMVTGTTDFFQIENLMDNEIETHHHEGEIPVHAVNKLADGMPAFGIVAAVMGVVHTMESVSLPPSELGILVAHALVGTFLGILLGYGFIGPLASLLEHRVNSATKSLQCIKVVLLSTINNYAPGIAIEFGRKVLYSTEKPSNAAVEELMKELKASK